MKKSKLKILLMILGVLCLTGLLLSGGAYLMGGRYPINWCSQRWSLLSSCLGHNWGHCWNRSVVDDKGYWANVEENWNTWEADFDENIDEFEERFEKRNIEKNCYNREYMKDLHSSVEGSIVLPKELEQIQFENVMVDLLSSKFELTYGNHNQIELENIDVADELSFLMYKEGDTLHIVERGSERDKRIRLTLGMEIQTLNIDGFSANVLIQGGIYQKLLLSSTSGSFDLKDVEAEEIINTATSGNLELNRVTAGYVSSSLTSGMVGLDEVKIGELDADLTSGSVKGNGSVSILNVAGMSGSLDLRLDGKRNDYDFDIDARNIEIEDKRINREFVAYSDKDGERKINASFASGCVKLKFTE